MVGAREFIGFAAGVLGTSAEALTLETCYGAIPQWDSMAHLRLVMEIAATYGTEIPFAEVTQVRSLWELWRRINGGAVKKIVAVDLDNTLWDGVAGEDGVKGIRPKTAFQAELKALKDRGVLLVALSKNNPEDVAFLFGPHDAAPPAGMVLKEEDFVSRRIDWASKADNLKAVAAELNLGLDAFVLVDDNPAERLEMRMRLPEVTVAEFPPALAAYFPERELTAEDRVKTEQYRAEARRKACLEGVGPTAEEIWAVLGCRIDVHPLADGEVARVAQLSQKANQFNVATNRYAEAEVRRLADEGLVVTVHAGDRFGDQGLVAYVVVKDGRILDWVMSCRVMGRGIEERVERQVERLLRDRGVRRLQATWRDSGRNAPVRDLFDRFGFTCTEATPSVRTYEKDI